MCTENDPTDPGAAFGEHIKQLGTIRSAAQIQVGYDCMWIEGIDLRKGLGYAGNGHNIGIQRERITQDAPGEFIVVYQKDSQTEVILNSPQMTASSNSVSPRWATCTDRIEDCHWILLATFIRTKESGDMTISAGLRTSFKDTYGRQR
jgi:hypothetical protein